jgi:hypothetical protein
MSNYFRETTHTSWFSRLMSSFMGVLFGFLMFLGSFVLLYFNEGRVNLSKIAKTAIDISANSFYRRLSRYLMTKKDTDKM